ncbi:MAG TPA: preprotein translocase subunit YajC [Balneola sp.]|jgi:preprotein translocase subunit YajC|nr:preprotein translocase subunit YajC [Bacteroidota bacterium]MAC05448.1 preprotein translocase subunit YajC [Balneola sp.]MAO77579.1 preprotein translocase subunit YajC [Balneola sp.]MBF63815.1 preprotein translocase subunit YajC [Balneola sp.]HAH50596.1 preprotein translocase subunit YajC [Balneola sp.]
MSLLTFFLMAPPAEGEGSGYTSLIFMGAIFVVFYFFIIRPQSKKQKEIQQKVSEMKKGDKVVTSSGMIGVLSSIEDDSVLIEVGGSTKIRFLKSAINDVNPNKPDKKDKK